MCSAPSEAPAEREPERRWREAQPRPLDGARATPVADAVQHAAADGGDRASDGERDEQVLQALHPVEVALVVVAPLVQPAVAVVAVVVGDAVAELAGEDRAAGER